MKRVFTHENRMILFNLRNILQGAGIETHVVNEFAAGGSGDLATFDTWPELWIEDESRLAEAQALVAELDSVDSDRTWYCRGCQEENYAAFQLCWKCGRAMD